MKKILIVFARKPEIGKVKTRLAKEIGDPDALKIYLELLDHTISVAQSSNIEFKVYWSETSNQSNDEVQEGNDLGEKMFNAICKELKTADSVCLIGTDTPFITTHILEEAFNSLETHDLIFGPAKDGGYYLVGSKAFPPKELFLNRNWSHANVLKEALEVAKKAGLKTFLTPQLLDIDTRKDLQEWKQNLN